MKVLALMFAAGLIWAGLIMLAGWSFGYPMPFFGSWVIGFAIISFRGGREKAEKILKEMKEKKS